MGADGRKIPNLRRFGTERAATRRLVTPRNKAARNADAARLRALRSNRHKFRTLEFEGFAMSEPTIDIILDLASRVRALNG